MSKFQVGDKVRIVGNSVPHGFKRGLQVKVCGGASSDETVLVEGGGSPVVGVSVDDIEHAGPHVSDVDGNPIRVGQLMERVKEVPGEIRRVRNLGDRISSHPEPLIMVEGRSGWFVADQWRVLTADDLMCPPEPDTRDVTLRVTVGAVPYVLDNGVAEAVRDALRKDGRFDGADWSGFTVEVVDEEGRP